MNRFRKTATVAILCTFIFGLFLISGCKKDKPNGIKEPEYPIDIQFTEYTLSNTCQWKNLAYNNTVLIINNDEELQQYITSIDGIYPEIDFSKHTLLVASGKTDFKVAKKTTSKLQQLSESEYELDVEIFMDGTEIPYKWAVATITEKVKEENKVKLNITCDKSDYPVEIPFTEYFPLCLHPPFCWKNLSYKEEIILINSMEQLKNYLTFNNNTNPVDFSKHSLLLVSGYKESGVAYIIKELQQISENDEYDLDIEIFLNTEKYYNKEWEFAIIVKKMSEKCTFSLKTKTTDGETDFIYRGNGEKDYFTFRKDKVIIRCNSKEEAEKLFIKDFFYWQDPLNYESDYKNVLATIINPLKVTILDILQLPEVVDATYGLEYQDYTLYYPTKSIYVEFKDGLTPEEVLDAIGISEKVEKITLVNSLEGYRIVLDIPFRDIFRICRELYESGLCKGAEPNFIRQMIIL